MRYTIFLAAVVAAALAVGLLGTAEAGKPANKGNLKNVSSAWMSAAPNPAAAWGASYELTGGGFEPFQDIQLGQSLAGGCCGTFALRADEHGNFSIGGVTEAPGDYIFTARVLVRNKWKEVATTTLVVE